MTFSTEKLIEDARSALAEQDAQAAVAEIARDACSNPTALLKALGEPTLGGINTIYHAPDLTILNINWAPGMTLHPHNHLMWAVIGLFTGQEENTFYRRGDSGLVQHGNKMLEAKDVTSLGQDIIHSVHNPSSKLTCAIHIYGGDFFNAPRSEWDPQTLEEHPFDIEHSRAVFELANQQYLDRQLAS